MDGAEPAGRPSSNWMQVAGPIPPLPPPTLYDGTLYVGNDGLKNIHFHFYAFEEEELVSSFPGRLPTAGR